MNEQHTPDELLSLTHEERAALAEDDAPQQVTEPEQRDVEELELRQDVTPVLTAAPVAVADNLQRVAAFEDEAQRQFEDGQITSAQYRDALARAADAREQVRWAQRKAELANDMKRQAEDNQWSAAVTDFMATTGAKIANSRAALIAFDEHVKAVTSNAAYAHLSDRAQLEKAFKSFTDDLNGTMGLKQRAAAYDDMGGRDGGGSGSARDFAALDRLASTDPMAYERAIGKLSPAEQEAYANFAG
ncbi:hypothetical protein M2323_002937 [Rhodoblastus acidophilus]|uniref:hypothetical protein n=1 Tax=Rhodoblastus acidophilus TaxID=1074 RepID=UPI00222544A8|nr:hypothetical protein [Rhodoblastus acidophilus]MCW2284936.1 hypothetical protein [Rhodoblastus acidophilus]MCW2334000.1 hypothetical protein [Rhodoblastus acidophilus]